ncbi:MAG: sigma-70 family RNA polymerase sigma factor, partial [Myxococcales bacterium]|nr:sigma-70 family RNA polymerase sigma factor [Myxococcales bacterium]
SMPAPVHQLKPAPSALAILDESAELEQLVRGLQSGKAWAQRALLEDHGAYVERVLTRILGRHSELEDLVQEVFIRALCRVDQIEEPSGLRSWLAAFAVFVAREALRKRRRRSWLLFSAPEELPEPPAPTASPELLNAYHAFYDVLGKLDVDLRIAFALRWVEGMELTEVAALTDVSLATAKRRLKSARERFVVLAATNPFLQDWLGGRES